MLEQQVRQLMQKTADTNGLKLNWIRSEQDLALAGEAGLFTSYCKIFAEAPYEEYFDPASVSAYFLDILKNDGIIFIGEKDGEAVSFVASIPLCKKPAVVPVVSPYVDISASCYFAEDAVTPSMRRRGISRSMKALLIETNKCLGFKMMVLRTSSECTAQTFAVNDIGFEQIPEIYQDVESLKLDRTTRTDRRVFFTRNLTLAERYPQ